VNQQNELDRVLGASWSMVLQQVDDAVLVLDRQRTLRFVNDPARRLLGYEKDQVIGGRCRLTTRGVDCENACPLTFALEGDIDRIEGFSTVYRAKDGRAVPLEVTVIPLRDEGGEFVGAVEILHPAASDPGFFLSGSSPSITGLKTKLARHGRARDHLVLVGDRPACRDVGRAVHRFAGLPEELFEIWRGTWDAIDLWPPGTMYGEGDQAVSLLSDQPPDGWQVIVGMASGDEVDTGSLPVEVVKLPAADEIGDDLSLMVGAWADQLVPGTTVSTGAMQRLTRMARDNGLEVLENVLAAAVAVAGSRVEVEHIPTDGYGSQLVDELLQTENPLAALESRLLTEVLHRSGWRMQEAAERLGVSRVTLWRKLKDHGIERPECAD
jgi:PAS domain S-box-containing protein